MTLEEMVDLQCVEYYSRGMRNEFAPAINAIRLHNKAALTLDDLQRTVASAEQRMKLQTDTAFINAVHPVQQQRHHTRAGRRFYADGRPQTAAAGSRSSPAGHAGGQAGAGRYRNNAGQRHSAPAGLRSPQGMNTAHIVCYACGGRGHKASRCPSRPVGEDRPFNAGFSRPREPAAHAAAAQAAAEEFGDGEVFDFGGEPSCSLACAGTGGAGWVPPRANGSTRVNAGRGRPYVRAAEAAEVFDFGGEPSCSLAAGYRCDAGMVPPLAGGVATATAGPAKSYVSAADAAEAFALGEEPHCGLAVAGNVCAARQHLQQPAVSAAAAAGAARALQGVQKVFIVDSGASHHIVGDARMLATTTACRYKTVCIADGSRAPVTGMGTMILHLAGRAVHVRDVLVVPAAARNVLSVAGLVESGVQVSFATHQCRLISECDGVQLAVLRSQSRLYSLTARMGAVSVGAARAAQAAATYRSTIRPLHGRYGCVSY